MLQRRALVVSVLFTLALALQPSGAADAPRRTLTGNTVLQKGDVCFCGIDADNAAFCFVDSFCDDIDACNSNADCPAGYACLIDNCCAPPKDKSCSPVCGDGECINPGVCGTYDSCEPPLVVELQSFAAEFRGGVVILTWTTASEIDNVGFRLLRARAAQVDRQAKDGDRVPAVQLDLVAARLIPAEGTALVGASYEYRDANPQEPGTVFYYLEDMDTSGKATLHGPVEVVVPRATRTRR